MPIGSTGECRPTANGDILPVSQRYTDGRPKFGLNFYALNKKGEFGAACLEQGGTYAVHDGVENRLRDAAYLFKSRVIIHIGIKLASFSNMVSGCFLCEFP